MTTPNPPLPLSPLPSSVTLTVHLQPGLSDNELARLGELAARRGLRPEQLILEIVRSAAADLPLAG